MKGDPLQPKGSKMWVYEEKAGLAIYAFRDRKGTTIAEPIGLLRWSSIRAALKRQSKAAAPGHAPRARTPKRSQKA